MFGRTFSWRTTTNPYHIFISEIMLQQTQTHRVKEKYETFIKTFPTFSTIAHAPFQNILATWQGLGYNRRAKFLQKSAQIITNQYNATLPQKPELLQMLPGIGPATAASIAAFAFNKPTVFVETNIRVVFMHFFLQKKEQITDKEILALVAQALDTANPKKWYYALMDYGVMLKAQGINPINKSKHYHKQSKFNGSNRQIRGAILQLLLTPPHKLPIVTLTHLLQQKLTTVTAEQIEKSLTQLLEEGFVQKHHTIIYITK